MWKCIECGLDNSQDTPTCAKCSAPRPTETLVGEQVGQWILERELGEGGMSVVFLARHRVLSSPVAIKILRSDLGHRRELIERFRTEAIAASQLKHDNVIQVLDFGHQKSVGFYMVLEFLEGEDLEEKIAQQAFVEEEREEPAGEEREAKSDEAQEERREPFPTDWIMHLYWQFCAGLEAAHQAGIIHRDLKPSNIFLVPRPEQDYPLVKILDFGIAKIQESENLLDEEKKLTRTGTVLGTPHYLAPEQLTRRGNEPLKASVDIYAAGVILYQLFTGKLPLEEPSIAEQMAAVLTRQPPLAGDVHPPLKDTALEVLLRRLLSKKPEDRPETIRQLWEELQQAAGVLADPQKNQQLREEWMEAYPMPLLPTGEEKKSRWWLWFLIVLLLGGGGWWAWAHYINPPPPPAPRPPPRPRKNPLAWMERLSEEANRAVKKRNYRRASLLLKKLLRQARRRKVQYDPRILFGLGRILSRDNQFWAARRYYQRYLQRAQLDPKEREKIVRQILPSLKKQIDQIQKAAQDQLRLVRLLLKRRNYKRAYQEYQRLFQLDPSLPSLYIDSAKIVEKLFPYRAVKLYEKALKLSPRPAQKEKLNKGLSALRRRLLQKEKEQATRFKRARSALRKRRLRRGLRLFRRALRLAPGSPKTAQRYRALLREEMLHRPRQADRLLRAYQRHRRRLRRRPSWIWRRSSGNSKKKLSQKHYKEWRQVARRMREVQREKRRLERALKRSNLARAQEIYPRLIESWKKVAEVKSPIQAEAKKAIKRARAALKMARVREAEKRVRLSLKRGKFRQAQTRYQRLISAWKMVAEDPDHPSHQEAQKKLKALQKQVEQTRRAGQLWKKTHSAMKRARQRQARSRFKKLSTLLQKHEAAPLVRREFRRWQRRYRRAARHLRRAQQFYRQQKWAHAERHYHRYSKLFPRAWNIKRVLKLEDTCRCNQNVPWKYCSKRHKKKGPKGPSPRPRKR